MTRGGPRLARFGVTATFALAGALAAVWTVRVPALADKLQLDPAQLGVTVLLWGLGALASMQVVGPLMTRTGTRPVLLVAGPCTAATLALIGLAPTYAWLLGAVVAFGMVFAVLDIAMNAHASVVEHAYGRPLMSGMHAGWSVGAVGGGLLGAATAYAGWSFTMAVVVFAAVGVPLMFALGPTYLRDQPTAAPTRARQRLGRVGYLLGAVAFAAFMIEGSVADWSGLFMHETLGADEGLAALAYPLFEAVMIVGRLAGDRVRAAIGDRTLLIAAGLASAAATALVVVAPTAALALGAFALLGLCVCTVAPVAFSLAGRIGAAAIARVTAIGYLGLLLGPTAIGPLADVTSLRVGLLVATLLAVALTVVAVSLPERAGRPT